MNIKNTRSGVASNLISKIIPAAPNARKARIIFFSVGISIHFDWKLACSMNDKIASMVKEYLPANDFEVICTDTPFEDHRALEQFLNNQSAQGVDGIVLYHAAYTTGEIASTLGLWLKNRNVPLLSYAMPEPTGDKLTANRLCSQNFVLGILNHLGLKYQWLFCDEQDPRFKETLQRFGRVTRAIGNFRGRKVLIAGAGRVPGFYDCEVNELAVLKRYQVGFDRVNLVDITCRMADFSAVQIEEIVNAIKNDPDCGFNNVPEKQFADSIRLALALMTVAREGNYLGISFKNWPELFDHFQIAGDGAMALVNDQGIPISDEADTGAILSMLILQQLQGEECIPSLADISLLDDTANRLALWHNGSASTRLVKAGSSFECRRHGILENYDPQTAWGLVFEFLLQPGPVTVLRCMSPDAASAMSFEGNIVESEMKFRGTYGEVVPLKHSASQIVGTIMDLGLDHHWLFAQGHFKPDIDCFNYFLDIEEIPISNLGGNTGFGMSKGE